MVVAVTHKALLFKSPLLCFLAREVVTSRPDHLLCGDSFRCRFINPVTRPTNFSSSPRVVHYTYRDVLRCLLHATTIFLPSAQVVAKRNQSVFPNRVAPSLRQGAHGVKRGPVRTGHGGAAAAWEMVSLPHREHGRGELHIGLFLSILRFGT
jgi:hypothetical protein